MFKEDPCPYHLCRHLVAEAGDSMSTLFALCPHLCLLVTESAALSETFTLFCKVDHANRL